MLPVQIKVIEKKYLHIKWDDNTESKIKLANLRKYCPCANCTGEKENQSLSYIPIYSNEQLTITSINIVGNYALNIIWKDGHNTGIYEFNFLKNISDNIAAEA
ncbi:DUF971 domain-containing protein [Melioribacteraceae bacterium 4301-Me]|uniref:DUF971 domain-containing protein n=1 Tax=Pyranulibacter aquaticus TaxID=3163344 RepID=UPI003598192D